MSWATEWGPNASFALLVLVIVADALFGTLPGLRQILGLPLSVIRGLAGWFDSKLNRVRRGGEARRMRGLLVVLIIAIVAWASGFAIDALARSVTHGWIIEAILLLALIRQRDCLDRMYGGWRRLASKKPDDARALVEPLIRYDAKSLDDFGVARAAIEGGMARFSDRFLATLFWYLLLGLPGVFVCRAINATSDVIGRPSSRYASFGFAATRMDDILNLVPSIAAGPIISFAAIFVPQAGAMTALTGWWSDLRERLLRPGYRGEGAMAGALGVALGGPRHFGKEIVPGAWVGDGRARATASDMQRAAFIQSIACLLVAAALALAVGA